jgi:GNAT superfamily N-acetyltransferase
MGGLGMGDRGQVTIRAAVVTDAPHLADLLTELGYPAGADAVRERLGYWLPDQASRILVAERASRIVGCISLHAIPYLGRTGRWLRIESLVVAEQDRGTGTGRALMAAAEQLAVSWNCLLIEVTSMRSRTRAHAFYRRLGFTDVCDRSGRFVKELAGDRGAGSEPDSFPG